MISQVLARKWRPKNFAEVVGQEHIIRALQNALAQQRLHHAYLFSGTRGVGKTTIARILAKCLNCETDISAAPCGKCDACLEIDSGRFIDLIEVDAASRTKVEDTRDLLDNVQYLPTKSRFKIYIIDEVHMLSGHSFNALLKTLEEPPAHVKFLLATTDPQKLPITILSRCLQFNLKALSPEIIQSQLQHILSQEQISYEDQALYELAFHAKGSVRDALSLLDQAIAFGHNRVTTADVNLMLGAIDMQKVLAMLQALSDNQTTKILEIITELNELTVDFTGVLDEILEILHQVSLTQLVPDLKINYRQASEAICHLATKFKPEEIQLYYQIALIGKRDLLLAPSMRSGFEMVMLRMLAFRPETVVVEAKVTESNITAPQTKTSNHQTNQPDNVLQKLEVTGVTAALLEHCVITRHSGNEIELTVDPSQAPLLNQRQEERISAALSKYYHTPIILSAKLGNPSIMTPAKIKQQQETQKQDQARLTLEQDRGIQELMDKFGAKIIANSLKAT